MAMKILTMATPDRYMNEARLLVESGLEYGIHVDIVPIASSGSWERNTNAKPAVLIEALQSHDKVLMLDADCRVVSSLPETEPDGDMALNIVKIGRPGSFSQRYRYQVRGTMWNSTVMFVTKRAEPLMHAWKRMSERRPEEWDQLNLLWAHRNMADAPSVTQLPIEYVRLTKHSSAFHRISRRPGQKPFRRVVVVSNAERWEKHKNGWLDRGFSVFETSRGTIKEADCVGDVRKATIEAKSDMVRLELELCD